MEHLVKKLVIYDKRTKIIIGELQSEALAQHVNKDLYDIKEIPLKDGQVCVGCSVDALQIFDEGEKTIVTEKEILKNMVDEVFVRYSTYEIVKILVDLIDANDSLIKTDEFTTLSKIIKIAEKKAQSKIDAAKKFTDRFIYISIDEEIKNLDKKIDMINKNYINS